MFEDIYKTLPGRMAARVLAAPLFSYISGAFMDSSLSRPLIKSFIRKNNIDLTDVADTGFSSFNAFFTRRLKPGSRPLSERGLVSPCDGLLSVWNITRDSVINVKGTPYTVSTLTENTELADMFSGGKCLVFRLTPAHYHRYTRPCAGQTLSAKRIKGVYHTVRPVALENLPVFKTNTREYELYKTDYGPVLQMEVGALLVGRIVNTPAPVFAKGDEKGRFEFGGSTIVLMLTKDAPKLISELDTDTEKEIRAGEALISE